MSNCHRLNQRSLTDTYGMTPTRKEGQATGLASIAERTFQQLLEFTLDAMLMVDKDGTILLVNERTEMVFGYTREELLAMHIECLLPEQFRPAHAQHFANYFANPHRRLMEAGLALFGLRKDGTEFPLQISLNPLETEEGIVVACAIRDITERVRAEEQLRQSEERFRTICENVPVMIYAFDDNGQCLFANRQLQRVLGWTLEEVRASKDPLALFYPDAKDRDRMTQAIKRADGVFREYSVVAKSGSPRIQRWADFRLPTGTLISIGHDITEQKRAEVSLRESEQRLSSILESAMDAIITIDEQRQIILFNGAAEKVFRCTRSEAVGKSIDGFLCEKVRKLLIERVRGFLKSEETKHYLWIPEGLNALRADGEEFAIEATVSQAEVDGKKLTTIILRDVDDRRKAEASLAKLVLEKAYLREEIKSEYDFGEIIGTSDVIKKVCQDIKRVAGTDATILLTGETGTGKGLVARAIHNASDRKERELIKVNCSALPSGLIESELFGHEKGAFTGATTLKKGRFELADNGTIFLDEIGALALELQAKLLRVLQEHEFERVGSTHTQKVNVRVIAATNRNLQEDMATGAFRADLFYRLNIFPIHLAPLRERKGDIPQLTDYFMHKFAGILGKRLETLTPGALQKLLNYDWPGNVRELANIIERAVILCDGPVLQQQHIGISDHVPTKAPDMLTLADLERAHIKKVLAETRGVVGGPHGAAERLGMKRTTLLDRMKKLGLS